MSRVVFYTTDGLVPGQPYRFALQPDASSLPDGRYPWQLTITEHHSGGGTVERSFTGTRNVRNLTSSPMGNGWSLDFVDRLVIESGGAFRVGGDGNLSWFRKLSDGSYRRPEGELRRSTLVENPDGSFTMTDHDGRRSHFDWQGLMTAREDRFGNTTTFSYLDASGDGVADALYQMVDPAGRTTTLGYSGSSGVDFS